MRALLSLRRWPALALVMLVTLGGCVTEQVNVRPDDPAKAARLYSELGFGYLRQGRFDVAEEKFVRARDLAPKDAGPIYGMGLVFFEQGRTIEGRQLIDEAARKVGDQRELRKTIADWYCNARLVDEAGAVFAPAIRNGDPESLTRWSECLLRNNRGVAADEVLLDALRTAPNSGQYLLTLAERAVVQRDWWRARMFLQRYESAAPANVRGAVVGLRSAIALDIDNERDYYEQQLEIMSPVVLQQIDPRTGELRHHDR